VLADEPDSLVLEQLRVIRGDLGKLFNEMQTMRVEMTAMRQHMDIAVSRAALIALRSALNWRNN